MIENSSEKMDEFDLIYTNMNKMINKYLLLTPFLDLNNLNINFSEFFIEDFNYLE